jgi:hypothetical protein
MYGQQWAWPSWSTWRAFAGTASRVSVGDVSPVSGRIVALGPAGITVKLAAVLDGLDTVTVERARVTAVD